ncbi:hypothetical protein BH20GEM2_BH20GEM2_18630 [soil metagenome]
MIPGRRTRLVLEPTETGIFRGACAEYCGTAHAWMAMYAGEHRGGSPYARLMERTAHQLDAEQMRDVARYYASLGSVARP